jgi:glycogen(starch) synthase
VSLVVAGSGPELPALQGLADELGLGRRARFPGPLARGQVTAMMRQAEVFVLPSRVEPFGIVTLEAMAVGTAVLVSAIGGAPEIVRHGVDGCTVDPTDRAAFTAALTELLRDGSLRARLAGAGRHRAEEFSWPQVAAEYRRIYGVVAAGGRPRPAGTAR